MRRQQTRLQQILCCRGEWLQQHYSRYQKNAEERTNRPRPDEHYCSLHSNGPMVRAGGYTGKHNRQGKQRFAFTVLWRPQDAGGSLQREFKAAFAQDPKRRSSPVGRHVSPLPQDADIPQRVPTWFAPEGKCAALTVRFGSKLGSL